MRKLIALGAAIVLPACGGDGGMDLASADPFCQEVIPAVQAFMAQAASDHPTPDDDRYGGTVVVGGLSDIPDGMNSAAASDYVAIQHQQFVNLMTLLDYDADQNPRPYLAESWDISDDQSEITFHIRRDVVWHDGEPTDAHDVAFTYRLLTNPAAAYPNVSFWDYYDTGEDGIEVVDDYTVRLRLQPHAEFLDAWRVVGILPEHLLGDVAPSELGQHPFATQCPVGNGPFVFESHAPQDRWIFTANAAFPEGLGGRPYADRYVYKIIPDQATALNELLTEAVHVYISPRPDQAQRIVDDPGVDLLNFTSRNYVFIGWNTRRPQLADARVRRALTMGVNRSEIVQAVLQGYGSIAHSGVPPFHWAYDPDMRSSIEYDPPAAAALLGAAGWTDRDGDGTRENADGLPLSISIKYNAGSQQRQDMAEIMQAQLADIGVDLRPEGVEFGTLIGEFTNPAVRNFDGLVMGWFVEYKLDDTDLFHSERADYPWALSGLESPRVDGLLEALSSTLDRDDARPLWKEYQQALNEEQPYTFFFFPDRIHGVSKRLRSVEMDARGEWVNIRQWHLDESR